MVQQNKYFIIFLISLLVLMASCSLQPVELKEIGGVDVQSVSANSATIKVSATINNPNHRINIKNSEVFVYLRNKEIGKITQLRKITLEGKTTKKYTTLLKIELTNLKGGMLSAMSLLSGGKKDLKISGKTRISMPFYWKTYDIKDYPVKF